MMAEAAESSSAVGKVYPSLGEQSDFECAVCSEEVEEQRVLPCRHYFCANCIDTIRTSGSKECPHCRDNISKAAKDYPVISRKQVLQGEYTKEEIIQEIDCQVEECTRPVDFYCATCKSFTCYRCLRTSKCTDRLPHNATDIRDLLPLAKEMFADWEGKKQDRVKQLHNEISQFASTFKDFVLGNPDHSRNAAQEMVQTAKNLYDLTAEKAGELDSLEYYAGILDKISETDLIQLVQQMSTDTINGRKEQEDHVKKQTSKKKNMEETNIKENIKDWPELPVAAAFSALAKKVETLKINNETSRKQNRGFSRVVDSTEPITLPPSSDFDDYDEELLHGISGSLLPQVEEHRSKACCYFSVKRPRIVRNAEMGSMVFEQFKLVRCCACGKYSNGDWEHHYSRQCRWKKIVDQVSRKIYLFRTCVCHRPPKV